MQMKTVSTWGKKKIKSGEEAKSSAESDIQKQEPEEPEEDAILKSKSVFLFHLDIRFKIIFYDPIFQENARV